ncbi:MAG: cyclase family protein [Gammaproteobacteria bacterium]
MLGARGLVIIAGLALAGAAAAAEPASKWGAEDTLGAVNAITPASVLAATKLVTRGKRYALGMETSRDTPAFGARTIETFVVHNGAIFGNDGAPVSKSRVTGNDDWGLVFFGVGSQIDGFGHIGVDHVYYNGNRIEDFFRQDGLTKFSTSDIPPIVARGVVLDIVGYMKETAPERVVSEGGVDMLRADVAVNRAEIDGALARQGIALAGGDVVLVHTGYMALAALDPERYMAAQPGLGAEGGRYLADFEPVAVGADTFGVEIGPGEDPEVYLPVHTELITRRGIYILENMVTAELVADEAWEFMFVLGQARIKGTVQMIINPVAIR